MNGPLQLRVSRLAALLAVLGAPPALVAMGGGADLDLPFARVSWYETLGPTLAFAAALAAALWHPGVAASRTRARLANGLWLFGLGSLGLAVWASTSGGFAIESLSVRHALRPAALGATSLGLAFAVAGTGVRLSPVPALLALLVGGVATLGAVQADRFELRERIGEVESARAAQPDVLFIVVDTLRADALGFARPSAGAGEASATPRLDALAAESVVFDAAFAQAPWTLPSMMSLVTSRYASSLHPGWRGAWPTRVPLEAEPAVFAEILREAGYHTAGFVKNPMLAPGTGFERGYDVYEWVGGDDADAHSGRQLVDASLRWADEFARARAGATAGRAPFFLSLHFMDPHAHYRPPAEFVSEAARRYAGDFDGHASTLKRMTRDGQLPAAADVEQMRRLYRDEVRYVDAQLGRLLDSLAARGLVGATTWIVVTADHGEQFGEHGGFEHRDLHIETVHVPLLIRPPAELAGSRQAPLPARRLAEPIGLIDLVPTLLDALGIAAPETLEGRSRLARLRGAAMPRLPVLTEFGTELRATSSGQTVLLDAQGAFRFYDRVRDARELHELGAAEGAAEPGFGGLVRALQEHEARVLEAREPSGLRVAPAQRERLEALGYRD